MSQYSCLAHLTLTAATGITHWPVEINADGNDTDGWNWNVTDDTQVTS